jgi:hypothetical protein
MADVHWADRYAVDGMSIREMLLRERNEVTHECVRDRRLGTYVGHVVIAAPGAICAQSRGADALKRGNDAPDGRGGDVAFARDDVTNCGAHR